MISIRLKKQKNKSKISYSFVVCSKGSAATSNKFLEKIGFYQPIADKWSNKYVYIDYDRLSFWLKRGAKINNSVYIIIKPLLTK